MSFVTKTRGIISVISLDSFEKRILSENGYSLKGKSLQTNFSIQANGVD